MEPPAARARTTSKRRGDAAEAFAATRLAALGWTVLARQVRVGRKEIDLVAIDPGPPRTLVILEVRWRGSRGYGLVEETLAGAKERHLRVAVAGFMARGVLPDGRPLPSLPVRVDFIAVEPGRSSSTVLRHHRNALEAPGSG